MDIATIQALRDLNNAFYADVHESFSHTRQHAWTGWTKVTEQIAPDSTCRVLDVACGNLRFERFLEDSFPDVRFVFTCLDSCSGFARSRAGVRFVECDLIDCLLAGGPLFREHDEQFDLAVSFGFMHHVPTANLRERLLDALVDALAPEGAAAVSFWQFMKDERLARKARQTTREAQATLNLELDEHDYLLDWQGRSDCLRYCHDFSDGEIEELARHIQPRCAGVEHFSADGASGSLNGYLVIRR